jgi:hypothetical protein
MHFQRLRLRAESQCPGTPFELIHYIAVFQLNRTMATIANQEGY